MLNPKKCRNQKSWFWTVKAKEKESIQHRQEKLRDFKNWKIKVNINLNKKEIGKIAGSRAVVQVSCSGPQELTIQTVIDQEETTQR